MGDQNLAHAAGPKVRAVRSIRFAVREAWDALGLLCAASFTLFLAASVPIFLALRSIPLGIVSACLLLAPLFAGSCFLAHKVFEHDEPGYVDLWRGFRKLYVRALGVAAIQAFAFAVLGTNLAFYGRRQGFGFLLVTVLAVYALVFWLLNCLYHYPLIVAAEEGIVTREDGGKARLSSVFRNGFLLALSSPGYSAALCLFLTAVTIPLAISAVGMALVGAAFPAFVCMRAARDHLIHRGLIPPDPDPDEPVTDEVWKMRG